MCAGALLGVLVGGCAQKKPPPPKPVKPLGPPVIDGRRGAGSFPIYDLEVPTTAESLREKLEQGYRERITPPVSATTAPAGRVSPVRAVTVRGEGSSAVRVAGREELDRLAELRMELSEWHIKPGYEPSQFSKEAALERTTRVRHLLYRSEPIRYDHGSLSLRLEAEDAELHLLRDKPVTKDGQTKPGALGLVLAGARQGELGFYSPMSELRAVMQGASRKGASKAGVFVGDVDLSMETPDSRTLDATLTVEGMWLLVPLKLRITGRMTVDDEMCATFSNMGATGEGPAGDVAAAFIDKAMKKIDGRRSPLMTFRDGQTQVKDFFVRADGKEFEMRVRFGK
jgi:hypothetical protein